MNGWREFLSRFRPEAASVPWAERIRSTLTAAVGVLVVVALSAWALPTPPFVVAAVGASAVLVFGLPASPLAQPWSVVGSYLVSGLAGVVMASVVPWPAPASALAVGGALLAMIAGRCLHPPGGAVALFAVLGGDRVAELGFGYLLSPVLANAVLLVAVALVINNLVPGRRYPRPHPELNPHQTKDPEPLSRLGLRHQDLKVALEQYGRPLYISGEELDEVIQLAERQAWRRSFGELACADVMTRDLVTVRPETSLAEAWRLLHRHQLVGMPVVDGERRMVGCVTLEDFVRSAKARTPSGLRQRLWSLLKSRGGRGGRVAELMAWHADPVPASTPLAELVPRMTRRTHQVPVTDDDGRLVGVVTQSDLIAALYHGRLAEGA